MRACVSECVSACECVCVCVCVCVSVCVCVCEIGKGRGKDGCRDDLSLYFSACSYFNVTDLFPV